MATYGFTQADPLSAYDRLYGSPPPLEHQPSSVTTKSEGNPQISARAEWARRRTVYGAIYLPVLFLVIALTAVILVLPLYIFGVHEAARAGMTILTSAPLEFVLTISQIASHTINICVAVAMVVESFHLAAVWLQTQAERPTPLQLGLITGAVQSANILALFSNVSYMLGFTKDARRQRLRSTPLLRQATRKLVALVAGAYLVAIFDTYLHASARPTTFHNVIPYGTQSAVSSTFQSAESSTLPSFGRTMNRTMCAEFESAGVEPRSCLFVNSTSFRLEGEGTRVFTNTSSSMIVGWTDEGMAVALPSPIPRNVTYVAKALAIQTSCEPVTMSCLLKKNGTYTDANVPDYGCDSSVNMNITDVFEHANVAALGDNGNVASPPGNVSANPFRVGAATGSYLYGGEDGIRHVYNATTGYFYHGPISYAIAMCSVTVLEAHYTLNVDGSIKHLNSTKAALADTQRVATTLDTRRRPIQTILLSRIEGQGLLPNTSYMRALEHELSGDLVSMMSWPLAPEPVLAIQSVELVNGSELQIIPAVLMLTAQVYFIALCIYITTSAVKAARRTPYTRLARTKLFDPLAIVHALHGPRDPERDWEDDSLAMFGVETERDELMVGPKEAYTSIGRAIMFGVARRPAPYVQEGGVEMPRPQLGATGYQA